MRPDRALEQLGGVASTGAVLRLTSRGRLRIAVRRGLVVRDARGRYSLPGVDEAMRAASRLSAVLIEDSAAQFHGWKLKHRPASPCLAVPRHRTVEAHRRRGLRVRFVDLDPGDVSGRATTPGATVRACAARMPFDEALAIADSALRHRDVTREGLVRLAEAMPDRYRARCLRVWVDGVGRPDLLDLELGLVIEADSFEFHGRRRALKHDCERYNAFVLGGRLVVRFAYEHVMLEPDYVRGVLDSVVELLTERPVGLALEAVRQRRSA